MSERPGFDVNEVKQLARGFALLNAVEHGGRAALGPVMGKIIAERPELKPYARMIARLVAEVVNEVNRLSLDEQRRILEEEYSWLLERLSKRRTAEEKHLPPLPAARQGHVVTRFAPNPDFVLHIGNARAAVLSFEYARLYKGKMILRFEDTDPRTKQPMPEAYELIREDLRWLGVRWDEEYIQSLRMELFYDVARKLIEAGGAYVDTEPPERFREYRDAGKLERYPPRLRSIEDNLELWDKMLEGYFGEGEAVVRVKTDPHHPDPSIRDWVAFRIIDTSKTPHPLVGDRYVVWPTYNFAAAVDDHLMGVTHILRAREHAQNTIKQQFLYSHLGWKYPIVITFGRLKLEGMIMSKSALRRLAEEHGVQLDDPRLATLRALRRRGIDPETIRRVILDVGIKQTDASISYVNLASLNRSIVDPKAKRVMAAIDPIPMIVEGLPWREKSFNIPYHPSAKLGSRVVRVKGPTATLYVSKRDYHLFSPGKVVRLMEAFNVTIVRVDDSKVIAQYHSESLEEARKHSASIVQWVVADEAIPVEVLVPEGLELRVDKGLAESAVSQLQPGDVVQLVRYGFARVDHVVRTEEGSVEKVVLVFAHE
jgi:glutamyl-tRNA synthetase